MKSNEVKIEIHTAADSLGRQQFTSYWADDYLPPSGVRGQVFFASPESHVAEWRRRGYLVRIVKAVRP